MEDPLGAIGFKPSSLRMKRAWDLAISPAKVRHLLFLRSTFDQGLIPSSVATESSYAGLHALHVRVRRPDLLHGHGVDAAFEPDQGRDEHLQGSVVSFMVI